MARPGIPDGPHPARVRDVMLGGRDNFAADREAAGRIEAMFPGARTLARQHREFARRATTWLASRGVAQFVDVGCGLPCPPTTGQVARETLPGARVAYADCDPLVLDRARRFLASEGAVVEADPARPETALDGPGLRGVIDLSEPVGMLLCGVLSGMDGDAARAAVAGYTARLAAGSGIAISVASWACQERGDEVAAAYKATVGGTWYNHSRETVASFFSAAGLRPWPLLSGAANSRQVSVISGVGLKQ